MITITLTPRQFGNIAALAICSGQDITTYLIRETISRALAAQTPPSPPETPAAHPLASAPAEIPTPVTSTEELYNLSK